MKSFEEDEAAAFTHAAAAMLGLPISAEHVPGVVANMRLLRVHADLVLDFPIPPDEPS